MLLLSFTLLLNIATAAPTIRSTSDYNNFTIAIVRAEPANWPMLFMGKSWTDVQFDINAAVARCVNLEEKQPATAQTPLSFPSYGS
jgi:hypothetical protein